MAWTDYSNTLPNGWDSSIGEVDYDASVNLRDSGEELFYIISMKGDPPMRGINSIDDSYNIPGFEDGYQPEGVNNPITGDLGGVEGGDGGGGGDETFARDSYINSDSAAATSWTGTIPTVTEGDLMVAVLMHRQSGGTLTPPTGWTQQGPDYLTGIIFSADSQRLAVYTKVAAASEPATVTWTQASSARMCGFLVSLVGNNLTMGTVAESYGNAQNASIANAGADFYITAATWLYSASPDTEEYSQTGAGVTEISDSDSPSARISGGYSSSDGMVESFHSADENDNSPNHGMISIPFTLAGGGSDGGGGSTRPTSGFLYPRGQG
jgi:hypothetical protein